MLKQSRYTRDEYSQMFMFAMQRDNLSAAADVRCHEEYFDKTVIVVRGRKVPHGTRGTVVYFSSVNYSGTPIIGVCRRIGIKDADGKVFYTALENVQLVGSAGGAEC